VPVQFAYDLRWIGFRPSDARSIRRSDQRGRALGAPPCFQPGRSSNSQARATVSVCAGLARVRQALRRHAAMLPMQCVPTAARRVHARSGQGLHEVRCAALPNAAARHARRSSVRALRNEAPLRCGAQVLRNAARVLRYAEPVPRNVEPVLRNVGLERRCAAGAQRCAGPPLRDAVHQVDRALRERNRSSRRRVTIALIARSD
jgi:hypothetical protein